MTDRQAGGAGGAPDQLVLMLGEDADRVLADAMSARAVWVPGAAPGIRPLQPVQVLFCLAGLDPIPVKGRAVQVTPVGVAVELGKLNALKYLRERTGERPAMASEPEPRPVDEAPAAPEERPVGVEELTDEEPPITGEEEPTADEPPITGEEEPTADEPPITGVEEATSPEPPQVTLSESPREEPAASTEEPAAAAGRSAEEPPVGVEEATDQQVAPALRKAQRSDAPEQSGEEPKTDGMGSLFHRMQALSVEEKKRLALRANKPERHFLARDTVKSLHLYVLRNPNVTPQEVAGFVAFPRFSVEAIRRVASTPEWMANRRVAFNILVNPASPNDICLNIIRKLNAHDLQQAQRSGKLNPLLAREVKQRLMKLHQGGK